MNASHHHSSTDVPHAGHQQQHQHQNQHGASASMAASATLHCLTGCAIGEILGLLIGTALGLSNLATIPIAIGLAFLFGYTLSTVPLLKAGLAVGTALGVVLAADTLSILTMEVVDNLVMLAIPGAMEAGLVNVTFWLSMVVAFSAAFAAAFPVNKALLARGKGHALIHEYHGADEVAEGWRRFLPSLPTSTLVAVLVAFVLGGVVVSVADTLEGDGGDGGGHASVASVRR